MSRVNILYSRPTRLSLPFTTDAFRTLVANDLLYTDDPELFHGMPIGFQIVCKRLEEEKVLRIAEEVQNVLLNAAA